MWGPQKFRKNRCEIKRVGSSSNDDGILKWDKGIEITSLHRSGSANIQPQYGPINVHPGLSMPFKISFVQMFSNMVFETSLGGGWV